MDNSETVADKNTPSMNEIPVLNDYAEEQLYNTAEKTITPPSKTKDNQPQAPESNFEDNPFLPYEHLAKLAMEREQFKQDLEAFTHNMKQESAYGIQQAHKSSQMIQSITDKIIEQLKPVIEQQVSEEVSLYFKNSNSV